MNRLAPLTCCLLVGALCAAILGWAAVAMLIVLVCAAFEFLLPSYAPAPQLPSEEDIEVDV